MNKEIIVQDLESARDFLERAESVLYQKEAEHGLMLGLTEMKARNSKVKDTHRYFQVDDQQGLSGYVVATEKNFIISAMSASMLQSLVLHLHKKQITSLGIVGPSHAAETFARIYSQIYGLNYRIAMDQKVYQLDQVVPARLTDGHLMIASEEHIDLGADWLLKFIEESLPHEPSTMEEAQKILASRIKNKDVYMWVNDSGKPVALNMTTRPTRSGIAVSFVYTPKQYRGKGYASALVAETSQRMLDSGKKFCVLYTDATNPTSNGIYQKIGYNEIATSKNYIFIK